MPSGETPERKAERSFDPVARMARPSGVRLNQHQKAKSTTRSQTELEMPSHDALLKAIQPWGRVPPSVGRTRRAMPERIDQVARVTKKGCNRSTVMRTPLTTPTKLPRPTISPA